MWTLFRFSSHKLGVMADFQRCISTTGPRALDKKWRQKRGLPLNPNEFGPLTNLPDYTFMDGRPTPIGMNLNKRLIRQKNSAQEIVEKISEIDFAKERAVRLLREKEDIRQRILNSRFKAKGHLLLKK